MKRMTRMFDNDGKQKVAFDVSPEEKRAMRMLAGALGMSISGWTREILQEKWNEKFPDMQYPDEEGNIKPKKGNKS